VGAKVEILENDGRWKTAVTETTGRTITVKTALQRMSPVILRFAV
jgi:hypothetical protein